MTRAIFISAGVAGIAAVILAMAVTVVPQRAAATAAFAQQTGKPCGACHVNKAGGGKLTAAGAKFAKTRH